MDGPSPRALSPQTTATPNPQMPESLAQFVTLPQFTDPRGNLSFAESGRHIPFEFSRIYYIYDIPSGAVRARHAHKTLWQFIIPMSGSFDVRLHDGKREETVTMNRPNVGLVLPPRLWHDLLNFSSGAVCLALASAPYDEDDYIRYFDKFLAYVNG
jgi:dTDP-4-dehydrorhamnose 3,5-epimerase-like enzyme